MAARAIRHPGPESSAQRTGKVCGTVNATRASSREMDRSRGQMYSLVTMPKATKLISTLSPNTAGGVMEHPHAHRDNCCAEFCT